MITALFLLIGTNAWGVNLSGYFGNSYAVVIGIHEYQDRDTWPDVTYAVEDADDMVAFFLKQGFRRNNVKLFTNDRATRESIISYLVDDLARTLQNNDRVVFYFSGHGETEQIGINDFGYIIPYDGKKERPSTWISMEKLQELAAKLGNARHQLFILDSCFGGLIEPKGSGVSSETPFYLDDLTNRRVRLYMTAGGANEKAPMRSSFSKNSHYTANLLRGLNGLADKNYDGIVTTSELEGYLLTSASIRGVIMPRWGTLDGHENGEFIFSSPKTARKIVRNPSSVSGPTKGNDRNSYEVERLRAEVKRLERLRQAAEKSKRESYTQPVFYLGQRNPFSASVGFPAFFFC
ncbi:MAG: caspase family protein [Candidatus Electrothrix sp. EH2]|nr:caspase family protein [Candidatus Electrothrix sp. EH2]